MKLKQISVIIMLIFILIITGCGKRSSEEEPSTIKTNFVMGTMVTVTVYGENRNEVAREVLDELDRIEKLMSINLDDSEIIRVNKNAGIKPVKVSDDTYKVVQTACEFAEKTDGLFDPSVGPLVQLWGIGSKNARVPSKEEIAQILPLINYKNIILNEREKTIYLSKPGMIIDVGGIAKGYAADRGVEIFKQHNVKYGYVNIGGNVIVHGAKPDKSLWKIGVQDPRAPKRGDLMGVIEMHDQAIVTSGDYERYYTDKNGKRYHHILNPKTGYPAEAGLISASTIGDNSLRADALSTSVFLLGAEKGQQLAEKEGFKVILITDKKKVIKSSELGDKFEITVEGYTP